MAWNGAVSLTNTIVWRNRFGTGYSNVDVAGTGSVDADWSNVEGGAEGIGRIDADPVFTDDSTYYLDALSPCVGAGNSDLAFDDLDDPATTAHALWPSRGAPRNDMDAFGGPGTTAFTSPPPDLVFVAAAA